MGQLPLGLAKWQAEHKNQASTLKKKPNKQRTKLPAAVYNNVPGLPNVGKRHAKVMTDQQC